MPTLLLDNFLDLKYSKWFSRYRSDDLETYRASEGSLPDPEELGRFDHVILSGSEDSIVENRDWVEREMEVVRELVELRIPTIGFCYGHQLIARALAGPEAVRHSLTPEFGWLEISRTDTGRKMTHSILDDEYKNNTSADSLFGDLPPCFFAFNSHFDEVVPETLVDSGGFQILARSAGCAVQALKVRETPMWGTQFHPEINIEDGALFLLDIARYIAGAGHDVEEAVDTRRRADEAVSTRLFKNLYLL